MDQITRVGGLSRRGFFGSLLRAAAIAVVAPYMAFAPMVPRVRKLADLNAILKEYYLGATRELLNSKRVLSNLIRHQGSFTCNGQHVEFALNFREGSPTSHIWARMDDRDGWICSGCARSRSGFVECVAPKKDAEIRDSDCFPEDREENLKALSAEKLKWVRSATDHQDHIEAHQQMLDMHADPYGLSHMVWKTKPGCSFQGAKVIQPFWGRTPTEYQLQKVSHITAELGQPSIELAGLFQ